MGSRLALDSHGRLVAVVSTADGSLPVGYRFRVLGNLLTVGVPGDPPRWAFLEDRAGRSSRRQPVRRTTVEPPREVVCTVCGQRYAVSARNARAGSSKCALCRGMPAPPQPSQKMFDYWTSRYTAEQIAELGAGLTA